MIRRLLSIALAATVLSCPLFCRMGAACCATGATAKAGCDRCHEHDADAPADQSRRPDSQDKSQGNCQCICGGAVIEFDASHVIALDVISWIALPIDERPVTAPASTGQGQAAGIHRLGDDMNPGRALRCLFMSYLC
jgi:hypothetical protein